MERLKIVESHLQSLNVESKKMKEINLELEGQKQDFDFKYEEAIKKKESTIKELRESLESAYKDSGRPDEKTKQVWMRNTKPVQMRNTKQVPLRNMKQVRMRQMKFG